MHPDLVDIGWTDEHWNRICTAVTEEAQKGRVAAQMLPLTGPVDPSVTSIPNYTIEIKENETPPPDSRLTVDSDPTLYITTLAVNVQLRTTEVSDPDLNAALVMFRRAANYVARLEDLLVFNGRNLPDTLLVPRGMSAPTQVSTVKGPGTADGLLMAYSGNGSLRHFTQISAPTTTVTSTGSPGKTPSVPPPGKTPSVRPGKTPTVPPTASAALKATPSGDDIITAIINSINKLDAAGQLGPYACALSPSLFQAICTPSPSLVLPRDRILPFLQGPLVRASTIEDGYGVVVALSASPVELVVATDIGVRFLQTTQEPRFVFRVAERVALRIKEHRAIGILF